MPNSRSLLIALIVVAGLVALTVTALIVVPLRRPTSPTAAAYHDYFADQASRSNVHGEVKATPVQSAYMSTADETATTTVPAAVRIHIARIGVDAKVVTLGLTPSGDMDVPKSPELVGWYDFTARPGAPGNAVLSGHLDWHDYGPAVFWKLNELRQGDKIEVELADGSMISYSVATVLAYSLQDLPMAAILKPTAVQSVTLITCAGTFSRGEYDERLIVRAVRTGLTQTAPD